MARVTVEDCVVKIPNRFDLVMIAAQRAREVASGAELTVERDDDKNPVVALREIAEDTVVISELHNSLIESLQKHIEVDEPEEDPLDLEMAEAQSATSESKEQVVADTQAVPTEGGEAPEEGAEPVILYEDIETPS